MRHQVLVTDYDGTLARDARVSASTLAAIVRLRASGRRLVLVTGRSRDELREVFDRPELFDRLVLENGAVLYDPETDDERVLSAPPRKNLVLELRRRKVEPLGVGRGVVGTAEPNQSVVAAAIRTLGLERELQITLNKGALMVLPFGVDKASGMRAALASLGISAHAAVGVGDAQNDLVFLAECEVAVAVRNALPALKERADLVTRGAFGAGVAELIDMLVADDLAGLQRQIGRRQPA